MQRRYGAASQIFLIHNRSIGDVFTECCYDCVQDANMACNFFASCYIAVSNDDRAWAIAQ